MQELEGPPANKGHQGVALQGPQEQQGKHIGPAKVHPKPETASKPHLLQR